MRFSEKVKQVFIWLVKAGIAGVLAIAVLSIFCVMYSYDGVHITNQAGSTDYTWEKNQWKSNMKEGFTWFQMDAYGFNNVKDCYKNPDILLIGSSNMEAAQVSKSENTGAMLNSLLPQYQTYNIGMSGHTIYRCIDNMEEAFKTHTPQKYVVLVTDSIDLSVDEMKKVIDEQAEAIPSYDSGIIYNMQKIPAVKVLYKQISDWIFMQAGDSASEDTEKIEKQDDNTYKTVLGEFLKKASDLAKNENLPLIIVYQPPQIIEEDGTVSYQHSEKNLAMFQEECQNQGIVFHDMTSDFTELYENEHQVAHGFSNTDVGGGHLNKYGHKCIAEAIVSEIQKLEAK